jgi:hypothetical protein
MLYCECPCVCCDTQVFLLPDGATGEGIRCPSCGRPLRAAFLQAFGEDEWLAQDAPHFLASFEAVRTAPERKRRLFACAGCRLAWYPLADARSLTALEVAERAAEGAADGIDFAPAYAGAWAAAMAAFPHLRASVPWQWVVATADEPLPAAVVRRILPSRQRVQRGQTGVRAADVAALLRCVFGHPFRPAVLASDLGTWRGGLLPAAARRMLDTRDFSAMPVLADMLEDAGCEDTSVLAHCRGPGPHAAGCFVLDGLLGQG